MLAVTVCVCVCLCAELDGTCTFCGAKVALTYRDRATATTPPAVDAEATAGSAAAAAGEATAAPAESAAMLEAVAFKDRLVEYDRNSAKRTVVIDDQSDYFEIDTNAWLTDEVRLHTVLPLLWGMEANVVEVWEFIVVCQDANAAWQFCMPCCCYRHQNKHEKK